MARDNYGHFINDEGVEIRVNADKRGKDHIDFYDNCPVNDEEHKSIHIDYDSDTGTGKITDTTSGKAESTDVECFLTTACMRHFQKNFDDDCYELRVLRWFRDNFVSQQDIQHYYKIAPYIVKGINNEEKVDVIYDYIYDNVVDYCVEQIVDGNYDVAYKRYKNSILVFEEQFARSVLTERLTDTLKAVGKAL